MKPGDKIVCIDGRPCVTCGAKIGVVEGSVYVLLETFISEVTGHALLDLVGIRPSCHKTSRRRGYRLKRFRRLDELKAEAKKRRSTEEDWLRSNKDGDNHKIDSLATA